MYGLLTELDSHRIFDLPPRTHLQMYVYVEAISHYEQLPMADTWSSSATTVIRSFISNRS